MLNCLFYFMEITWLKAIASEANKSLFHLTLTVLHSGRKKELL